MTTEARLFVAVVPSAALLDALDPLRASLARAYAGLRILPRESLHVTLKFLGAVEEARLADVTACIAHVLDRAPSSTLLFDELIALPRASKPRVIAVGAVPPPALLALVEQLEASLAELGFPREARPFRAHLTLGRARNPARLLIEKAPVPPPRLTLQACDIGLFQSRLGPSGAAYEVRARWKLSVPE